MQSNFFYIFMQFCANKKQNIKKEVITVIQLVILIIFVWALQCVFTLFQLKYFNREYINLRKKGFVLVGKQRSRISRGCVVLLLITREGDILDNKVMNGYTVFTKFKTIPALKNKNILDNWENEKIDAVIKKALCNAQSNYLKELETLNMQNISTESFS
jgi:glucitol operon activator protein